MELIDEEAKQNNIEFVKINDKRFGKSLGLTKFPSLSFFRGREIMIYEGDLKDEEAVLDFLTDEDNMAIPDKIEEVDADQLVSRHPKSVMMRGAFQRRIRSWCISSRNLLKSSSLMLV